MAERNIKCYTTEKSSLSFTIVQRGTNGSVNRFSEQISIKSSLFRENWMVGFQMIESLDHEA